MRFVKIYYNEEILNSDLREHPEWVIMQLSTCDVGGHLCITILYLIDQEYPIKPTFKTVDLEPKN